MAEEAEQVNQEKPPSGNAKKAGVLTVQNFSEYMALYLVIFVLGLVLAETANTLPQPAGSIVSSLLYFLFLLVLTFSTVGIYKEKAIAVSKGKALTDEQIQAEAPMSTAWILCSIIATLVSFGEICRHLSQVSGQFGPSPVPLGFWLWLRFGVDQLLDHVLFGMRSIFDWHISNISPTAPLSRAVVLLFNIDLDALVIASVLGQFQLIRTIVRPQHDSVQETNGPHGSVQEMNGLAILKVSLQTLVVLSLWVLPLLIGLDATIHDRLSLETAQRAVTTP